MAAFDHACVSLYDLRATVGSFAVYAAQDDRRPVLSRSSRITRMRLRTLRLFFKSSTVFPMRRLQFELAAVPGTLNRSLRASRSVIITNAIHDSQRKSASMIGA